MHDSPSTCVGFLQVLWFPTTVQNMHVRLTGDRAEHEWTCVSLFTPILGVTHLSP